MPIRNGEGIRIDIQPPTPPEPIAVHLAELLNADATSVVPWKSGFRLARFRWIAQEKSNWCWAACTDMILDFYGRPAVSQCQVANIFLHRTDANSCCHSADGDDCDVGIDETDVKPIYHCLQVTSSFRRDSMSFAGLAQEINAGRPVEVGYAWTRGGYHAAVVTGWRQEGTDHIVFVDDPYMDFGYGEVYFTDLQAAYRMGQWIWTWIGLERM